MSHTPGPWEKVEFANSDGIVRGQFLHHGKAALGFYHDGSPEGYANSTLAVAAPALVAALTKCEEYIATLIVPEYPETHDEDLSRCCSPEEPNDCLLCEIRAALALAKGE